MAFDLVVDLLLVCRQLGLPHEDDLLVRVLCALKSGDLLGYVLQLGSVDPGQRTRLFPEKLQLRDLLVLSVLQVQNVSMFDVVSGQVYLRLSSLGQLNEVVSATVRDQVLADVERGQVRTRVG